MKKLLFGMLLFFVSMSNVFAANNQNILYYVSGFYANSNNIDEIIRQNVTGYSYSCGPTSLLFINNHFSVEQNGVQPSFTSSTNAAISELQNIYSYIGQNYNTETSLNNLKYVARNWGWTKVNRRSASDSIDTNVEYLIDDLESDIPALVVLDSKFDGNSTKNTLGIDHIVVVYAYQRRMDDNGNGASSSYNDHQNDRIYFYDPYKGGNGYFKRGEINTAVALTGFAYLRVAP